MILALSEQASNTILNAVAAMLDGGRIELLTGDDRVLAVLRLSDPAAMPANGGELEFQPIADENAARARGTVINARIIGTDGSEVFSCDVGGRESDAVIKLTSTQFDQGVPVRLSSFRLRMP